MKSLPGISISALLIAIFSILTCQQSTAQGKQGKNQKFVIVLDVQQYWTDKSLSTEAADKMVKTINQIIEVSDPVKIIYVKSLAVAVNLSVSFHGIKKDTIFAEEFDRNLLIINENIFFKKTGDAFEVKELTDYLAQHQAKEIIITGLSAEQCISKTVLGGISRGFDIYLLPDAIGGKSEKSKSKAIKKLLKSGAKTISSSALSN